MQELIFQRKYVRKIYLENFKGLLLKYKGFFDIKFKCILNNDVGFMLVMVFFCIIFWI